jgi:adenosylmethionine-8-amino-7-oxononanoate aminotransferase
MLREFTLVPQEVKSIKTKYRRIGTPLPVPESVPTLEKLYAFEPLAMRGQPPVIWNRAEGFQVSDAWGNTWIDWSSGVLIANAGHGRPEIADAIVQQANAHLLTSFNFANQPRARLVERLVGILPEPLKKVFLYSIGSEAVECALKGIAAGSGTTLSSQG